MRVVCLSLLLPVIHSAQLFALIYQRLLFLFRDARDQFRLLKPLPLNLLLQLHDPGFRGDA